MFGDDPHDTTAVAESKVRCAARPVRWLEQAYRLKRLADELIDRWCEAVKVSSEAQEEHYKRFPMSWRFELDLKPGDLVPDRPGERESESRLRQIQSRVANGSPETYMQLAGQSVENLVKGLWVREHPDAVRSADHVAKNGAVLEPPANGHGTLHLLGPDNLNIRLPEDEANIAHRLELAVLWHGRYPIPTKVYLTRYSRWMERKTLQPSVSGPLGFVPSWTDSMSAFSATWWSRDGTRTGSQTNSQCTDRPARKSPAR